MYAAEHRSHGDPTQPYIAMTQAEAQVLADSLRALMVSAALGRSASPHDIAPVREFYEVLVRAHGLVRIA